MSLRWRLAIGLGAITALVIGLVGVGAYVAVSDRLQRSVDQSLEARAADVTRAGYGGSGGGGGFDPDHDHEDPGFTRPTACPPAGMVQPAAAAQLVTADGTTTQCIEGSVVLPVDHADLRYTSSGDDGYRLRTVTVKGKDYRVVTAAQANGSALQIARSLSEVDDVLSSMQRWLLGIGVAGVGAAVILGIVLARRTVRPIERLRVTTERIAATQDLAVAVPVGGASEIASLGRSFTTMVDGLRRSREDQQRLVSDASHELRTPLTSLRTNAELLGRGDVLTPEQRRSVVEGIELEVDELTHLVSELVELATDRSDDSEPVQSVDLASLATEVAQRATRRSGRAVRVVADGAEVLDLRPQTITRAIANLVDNALKYSTGPVEIAVTGTSLEVRDHGNGIPVDDQAHVFDRFYRSTTARTAPGSGLGLAIVKQAVEHHGGRVWAGGSVPTGPGAAVGFELPTS